MGLTEKEQQARKRVCLPLDGLDNLYDLGERQPIQLNLFG